MTDLETEQWSDLQWAHDVLAGRGDVHDNMSSAHNMLESISVNGVTQKIKHAASVTLMQGVAVAA
jgi:hypothetical protein